MYLFIQNLLMHKLIPGKVKIVLILYCGKGKACDDYCNCNSSNFGFEVEYCLTSLWPKSTHIDTLKHTLTPSFDS